METLTGSDAKEYADEPLIDNERSASSTVLLPQPYINGEISGMECAQWNSSFSFETETSLPPLNSIRGSVVTTRWTGKLASHQLCKQSRAFSVSEGMAFSFLVAHEPREAITRLQETQASRIYSLVLSEFVIK